MLSYFLLFFYSKVNIWVTEENQNINIPYIKKLTSLKLKEHMYSFTVQAAQKKTPQSGNGNLSLLISMNSTIAVNNEKCLLLTLNISKRHWILMKNSSMPNPFWKLKWNLGRKWALLWRWYQQLSENMTVNLRQLKRDYFTANYKFKAFEKFNNHQVQKRRVKSFFFIHGQIDWN